MTPEQGRKLISLRDAIIKNFHEKHWLELGALTGQIDKIKNHPRLLRSLSWGDEDYDCNTLSVLTDIVAADPGNFTTIEQYLTRHFETGGINVSSVETAQTRIYFTPTVFQTPTSGIETDLLSVMMPFNADFVGVYGAINVAALQCGMRCQRADDIWINSTVIQDIFSLIYRSNIVVCDFTGKNPNVFYEAGIAHTLGKYVVPITQHPGDIPFDLQAHRYLQYHNNTQGHEKLTHDLARRIATLVPKNPWGEFNIPN
jgi:AbiJ N-terminal domain 5